MTMRSPVDDSFNSYLQPQFHHRGRNVFSLLARREIAPRSKKNPRWYWGDTSKQEDELSFGYHNEVLRDARRGLLSWVEAESLRHLLATYCPLIPQPKSTIAVAFSSDGKMLASTHGDHTVKITDCQTGIRLKVLDGHQRTPWVVRFHPKHPEILASGSLDQQVRMWNALTSKCIGSYDFYRAIASISFHAEGEVLAIASGHKLYIWRYDRRGETSSPAVVLKTRRSLRAVNFHPHGGPFLLTAEVNDIASSESPMTRATSNRSFSYPSPVVYVANVHSSSVATELPLIPLPSSNFPSLAREESRADLQLGNQPIGSSDTELGAFALMQFHTDTNAVGLGDNLEMSHIGSSSHIAVDENLPIYPPLGIGGSVDESTSEVQLDSDLSSSRNQVSNPRDPTRWRLPFLQGWLMGQSRSLSQTGIPNIPLSEIPVCNEIYPSIRRDATPVSIPHVGNDLIQVDRIQSELVASLVAAADTELPCTVRLKMWSHDIRSPCDPLKSGCRLTIPYVVLCSEMGAHFSPCGRFLAACVACVPPQTEADPGFFMQYHQDVSRAGTSPTQHSISARQVMFELRIYSLEKSTFGSVLVSRPIRAAHCLTSIQFSPTSEHILLAYGRRHSSLLKSVVIDGETSVPVYTVLEIYRVSDMQLVSVLPSAEDEVNVASFHPSVGGGLAYGTQGGKLRFLKFEGSRGKNDTETSILLEQNIIED